LAVLLATLLIIVCAEEGNVVNFNFAGNAVGCWCTEIV